MHITSIFYQQIMLNRNILTKLTNFGFVGFQKFPVLQECIHQVEQNTIAQLVVQVLPVLTVDLLPYHVLEVNIYVEHGTF